VAGVEAAVAERLGRLAKPSLAALRVASVEGGDFTAEVVARVLETDERQMVELLSSELDRKHRLVRAEAIGRLGSRRVSRYRFEHYLFQKYLYDNMDEVERAYLHEDVGTVLEELYSDQTQELADIALQLARHFQEAEMAEKAIHYLHQAGLRAVHMSAYQESTTHLIKGLDLLMALPDSPQRDRQELALQLALGMALTGTKGTASQELKNAYTEARELCQQLGETSRLSWVLGELALHHYVRAEYQKARELGEEALSLAQQIDDPLLVALGHWYAGVSLFALGETPAARAHLEQVIAFYNPELHHRFMVSLRGSDAGLSALAYGACYLWSLGYPDQALNCSTEALTLGRKLGHPFTLADIVCYAGCLFGEMRRDVVLLMENAEELIRLADEKIPAWMGEGISSRGEALAMQGQLQEGIALMRQGMADMQSVGIRCYFTSILGFIAEAQAKAGQLKEGLATLDEAISLVEETGERYWEAELYRLRAELLLKLDKDEESGENFEKAIQVARRQSARSFELRATVGLARLWRKWGRSDEAQQALAEIYNWFTEGFDTPDLIEARALLEELHKG
jgi:predicted ATPase